MFAQVVDFTCWIVIIWRWIVLAFGMPF